MDAAAAGHAQRVPYAESNKYWCSNYVSLDYIHSSASYLSSSLAAAASSDNGAVPCRSEAADQSEKRDGGCGEVDLMWQAK